MSQYRTCVVSDTDTTLTLVITLNYMIFFQIIGCVGVSVSVSCPVSVFVSMLHRMKLFQPTTFCHKFPTWIKRVTDLTDSIPKFGIKRSSSKNNLRETSYTCNTTIQSYPFTNERNTVQSFIPPLVTRYTESRNGRSCVNELRDFLIQCET